VGSRGGLGTLEKKKSLASAERQVIEDKVIVVKSIVFWVVTPYSSGTVWEEPVTSIFRVEVTTPREPQIQQINNRLFHIPYAYFADNKGLLF
jgi:hypothetical protein